MKRAHVTMRECAASHPRPGFSQSAESQKLPCSIKLERISAEKDRRELAGFQPVVAADTDPTIFRQPFMREPESSAGSIPGSPATSGA